MTPLEKLHKLNACDPAIKWVLRNNYTTIEEIIDNCQYGDWLLWLANKCDMGLRLLILGKGLSANTVRHIMKDERSIKAVDTAIAFGRGEATWEELDAAYNASADAYAIAHINAAVDYAAYAAASAAYAAASTTTSITAYAAADAADAAEYYYCYVVYYDIAHTATSRDNARKENQMQTADICREAFRDELIRLFNEKIV